MTENLAKPSNTEGETTMTTEAKHEPNYFGDCPVCKRTTGYLNVGKCHWFHCDEHQTTWCAGANVFSSWHHESEKTWEANAAKLATYSVVKPYDDPSFRATKVEIDESIRPYLDSFPSIPVYEDFPF